LARILRQTQSKDLRSSSSSRDATPSRAIIAEDVVFWLRASDVLHRMPLAEAD
jgi:hypothetical protein